MEDEYGRLMTPQERENMADTQWVLPVIEKFPSRQAGEAVSRNSELGYEGYENALGGDTAGNPYSPFILKINWQFAKWAKLRGAGSTAVTELMGIEGVSCLIAFQKHS